MMMMMIIMMLHIYTFFFVPSAHFPFLLVDFHQCLDLCFLMAEYCILLYIRIIALA